jgi:coenzyme F420-reducing hydrogenase alpha subunit
MSLNIDICTRIEGHASIEYIMAKNEISAVNFNTEAFRGFESILKGKKLLDVPRIASRICGLCHASQGIASVRAIENMLGITPPASTRAMRAVLMCGELIKSHALHFFFQGYPDIHEQFQGKQLVLEDLIRRDPAFTSSMFELVKLGREVSETFGGREIHAISQVPGGRAFTPTPKEINTTRKQLEKASDVTRSVLLDLLKEYEAADVLDDFSFKNIAYMALAPGTDGEPGIYRQDGDLSVMYPNGAIKRVPPSQFKDLLWIEPGMREYETPLDQSMDYMVGPLARAKLGSLAVDDLDMKVAIDAAAAKWNDNMFFNYAMQLVDIRESAIMAMSMLDGVPDDSDSRTAGDPVTKGKEGIGIVEAPRGTLIHHYTAGENDTVDAVELYIATKINIPAINRILTRRSRELQDKGLTLDEIKRRAGMIVRTFDPCISCATHVIRTSE